MVLKIKINDFYPKKKGYQLVGVNIFLKPRKILHLLLKRRRDLIPYKDNRHKINPILKE